MTACLSTASLRFYHSDLGSGKLEISRCCCTIDKVIKSQFYIHSVLLFFLSFNFSPGTLRFGIQPVWECGDGTAPKSYPSNPGGRCFCEGHVSVLMVIRYFINYKYYIWDALSVYETSSDIFCSPTHISPSQCNSSVTIINPGVQHFQHFLDIPVPNMLHTVAPCSEGRSAATERFNQSLQKCENVPACKMWSQMSQTASSIIG